MFGWFKEKIEAFTAQQKLARQVDPYTFKKTAHEIRDLAILATQLNPRNRDIQKLIRNVRVEMDRLSTMADRPELRRLSVGKRLLLRQGLKESRVQLLESIESAPSPTQTIQ